VPLLSFGQFNPFQKFFRESLKYEDIIRNQLESCRQIFNRGDSTEIMYAVQSLLDFITPNILDEQFIEDMQDLEDEWNEEKAKIEAEYTKNLRRARNGCPDLVAKSQLKPGVEHWKKTFMKANALLERKNLGLKIPTVSYDSS